MKYKLQNFKMHILKIKISDLFYFYKYNILLNFGFLTNLLIFFENLNIFFLILKIFNKYI